MAVTIADKIANTVTTLNNHRKEYCQRRTLVMVLEANAVIGK